MRRLVLLTVAAVLCAAYPAWAQLGGSGGEAKADARVRKALEALEIKYEIDSDGDFRVLFEMGEGRSQLAIVRSMTTEYRNLEVREIWSVGYKSEGEKFPADVANALLEDTFPKKLGAWAKMDNLAIFVVKFAADCDNETLLSCLKLALEAADTMEEKFTGDKDEF